MPAPAAPSETRRPGPRRPPGGASGLTLWLLCLGFMLAVPLSLCMGNYPVPLGTVARIVAAFVWPWTSPTQGPWTDNEWTVVLVVRLPRVALAVLAGTGLGLAGATLQGVFRNPLVGPDVIGISAGAACGAVLAILAGGPSGVVVAAAFGGGIAALLAAAGLTRLARAGGTLGLLLAGFVVSAFLGALLSVALLLADPDTQLASIVYWLMGSLAGADATKVATLAVVVLGAGSVLLLLRWRINLLSLGEIDAASLGVRTQRLRWAVVALVALIVAAQVSVSGTVGWVGIVVPHLARALVGADHRRLMPASALLGGIFLLGMDDLGRSLVTQEIPIGIVTACIGAPAFAVLLWRRADRGWAT